MEEFVGVSFTGVTSCLSSFLETEVDEDFFGGLGGILLSGMFGGLFVAVADRISLGVNRVLKGLFIGVCFNRVSDAFFLGRFFFFTAMLCCKVKYYKR